MNILLIMAAAGLAATIINFVVARSAARLLNAPPGFAPFTLLPIAWGCFTGAVLAGALYFALQLVFEQPQILFVGIAFAVLLISFHLPFRLTNHRSPRFAGATRQIQLTLCAMHTIVAVTNVFLLLFLTGS